GGPPTHYASLAPADSSASATNSPADEFSNRVSGVVKTGDDVRTRGTPDANPLRIDGSRGNWDQIEELWLAGELTDDEFEDHFIDDVIVEDIGEGTDGWEFPGASYAVEVR
ncbi:hypothetical protein ACFV9Y_38390, partial [Streptomyces sp. NPDC059894]